MTREEVIAEMEVFANCRDRAMGPEARDVANWLAALREPPGPSLPGFDAPGSQSHDGGLGERGAEFERELLSWLSKNVVHYPPHQAPVFDTPLSAIVEEARKLAEKYFGNQERNGSMKIYVAYCSDRHYDPVIAAFSDREKACQ